MRTWTSILAAGAILAFAAPAGYAANSNIPSDPSGSSRGIIHQTPAGKPVKAQVPSKAQAARIKELNAKNKLLFATIKFLAAENRSLSAKLRILVEQQRVITPAPVSTTVTASPASGSQDTGSEADSQSGGDTVAGSVSTEPLYEDC